MVLFYIFDKFQFRNDIGSGNSIAGGPSGGHGIGGNSGMGSGWTTSGNMNRDRGGPMGGGGRDYGVLRDRYGMPRNYGSGRNDRYSPGDRSGDMSPPTKRIRSRDWDERYGGPNYELGGGHHSQHGDNRGGSGGNHRSDNFSQDRDADEYDFCLIIFLIIINFFYILDNINRRCRH